jgi:hypothetical protein
MTEKLPNLCNLSVMRGEGDEGIVVRSPMALRRVRRGGVRSLSGKSIHFGPALENRRL